MGSHTIEHVEFPGHHDVTLRGLLYRPDHSSPSPVVVMSGGFSVVKEMALPRYATVLADAGVAVLLYDHRNLGESDGEPRQEINPWAQARDIIRAIDWIGDQPGIDPRRIGLWGSSFSGGEVMVVGAIDDRVGAVASLVPFAGLPDTDYTDTNARFETIRANLLDTSGSSLADPGGHISGPMAVVEEAGSDVRTFLPQPEAAQWFLAAGGDADSRWSNEITLRNAFGTDPPFDPGVCAAHLASTPILVIIATEDRIAAVDDARSAFERIAGPKSLLELDGHHFIPYTDDAFDEASTATRDFFVKLFGV